MGQETSDLLDKISRYTTNLKILRMFHIGPLSAKTIEVQG